MFDGSTIQNIVTRHLALLHEKFMRYFPSEMRETEHIAWVRNHFEVDCSKLSPSSEDESTLIELSFDRYLKKYKNQSLKLLDVLHAQSFGFIYQMNIEYCLRGQ